MGALSWTSLLPGPPGSTTAAAQQGAAFGLEQGQKMAALHALHNANLGDQGSVDAAITNSVRAGALDQATGLMNLNFTRQLRSQLPSILQQLGGLGGQPQTQSSQPPPATADATSTPADLPHAQETMGLASQAVDKLLATPVADRPAAFAQVKQDFLNRGIPEAAIDAAGADLSDAGLQSLKSHYGDMNAHMAGGDNAPAMPSMHPTTYSWASNLLSHPDLITQLGIMKGAGLDLSPLLDTAKSLAAPEISAAASAEYAPQQAYGTAVGQNTAEGNFSTQKPPFTGAVRGTLPNGQPGWVAGPGALQGQTATAGATALGTNTGGSGGEVTFRADGTPVVQPVQGAAPTAAGYRGAVTGAEAGARAPYTPIEIKLGDGSTVQAIPDGHGGFTQVHQGGNGTASPGFGVSPSPQRQAQNIASANQYQADKQEVAASQASLVPMRKVLDIVSQPNIQTGPATQAVNTAKSFINANLSWLPAAVRPDASNVASLEEARKYMVQIAGAQAAQYGPGTNEKLAVAASGNANPEISKMGIRDVMRMNIALKRAKIAQEATYSGAPEGYSDYAANFARTVDPRAFMLDLVSKSERDKLLSGITSPTEKAAMKAGVAAALRAGIYQMSDIPR